MRPLAVNGLRAVAMMWFAGFFAYSTCQCVIYWRGKQLTSSVTKARPSPLDDPVIRYEGIVNVVFSEYVVSVL